MAINIALQGYLVLHMRYTKACCKAEGSGAKDYLSKGKTDTQETRAGGAPVLKRLLLQALGIYMRTARQSAAQCPAR